MKSKDAIENKDVMTKHENSAFAVEHKFIRDGDLTDLEFRALISIVSYKNMSLDYISEKLGVNSSVINSTVERLVSKGYLKKIDD